MQYGKYHFFCRFDQEAILPYYKGSTIRGVFGIALKKVVCALKRERCDNCLLRQRCLYYLVFETTTETIKTKDSKIALSPNPFVIEPLLSSKTHFKKDDIFDFNLLLFGDTNHQIPYFIYAFEQIGKIGIGKNINGQRGNFLLENVKISEHLVYSSNEQLIDIPNNLEDLCLSNLNQYPNILKLKIILETPLRLKFENKLKADLPFHVLTRSMLRRISSLLNCFGAGEPDIDYRGMVKRAENIKIVSDNISWFDWRRYSNRQDQDMLMGGIIGEITYEGEIGEYMPLIDFCSKVHVGKQTAFGLGKIKAVL